MVSQAALEQLAERMPDSSLGYEWHADRDITLGINVTAPNAATAMVVGAALFWEVIPHPPKIVVTTFEAHQLKAEPDFI